MKIWMVLICGFNALLGMKYFLNAIGILNNSKYARATDWAFAIILLAMCAGGLYAVWGRQDERLACLVAVGPWILIGLVIIFSMVFSRYQ